MAMRRLNVGKKEPYLASNHKNVKMFKTERFFKTLEELHARRDYWEKQKKEVVLNENLLILQYR